MNRSESSTQYTHKTRNTLNNCYFNQKYELLRNRIRVFTLANVPNRACYLY